MERVKKQLLQEKYVVIRCSMSMGAYTKYSFDEDIEQALENAENEMYREKTYHKKNDEVVMLRELILGLYERSPRQKSHSENTSRLCEKMGIVLGWPQSDIKSLADAGYYHDIGKIVLSDALLNKTSKLTSLEKMEKLQHPVVGYRILSLFDNTLDLAEAVYYHHERWDGSGYPKGLQGEEIPVHSRIIGLAEQYDHLRNRITDKPLGKEDALLRIQQLSGIKFDLKLTDKFISIVRQ
jgi:putative nucleotidyltransferase with HDIG domain